MVAFQEGRAKTAAERALNEPYDPPHRGRGAAGVIKKVIPNLFL